MKFYAVDPPVYEDDDPAADCREWFSSLHDGQTIFDDWTGKMLATLAQPGDVIFRRPSVALFEVDMRLDQRGVLAALKSRFKGESIAIAELRDGKLVSWRRGR